LIYRIIQKISIVVFNEFDEMFDLMFSLSYSSIIMQTVIQLQIHVRFFHVNYTQDLHVIDVLLCGNTQNIKTVIAIVMISSLLY